MSILRGEHLNQFLDMSGKIRRSTFGQDQAQVPMKYWAFISYSHKDRRRARKLRRKLEAYAIPKDLVGVPLSDGEPIPRHLKPVFLDRDELSSGPDLAQQINAALGESRSLVVLCSPSARASAYVESEILEFQKLGRAERIIAALTDAGPRGMVEDAFPRSLQGEHEPLAADFDKDGFNNAKLKIAAGILGLGFDELKRRDRVRERRQLFWVSASVVLCAILYILLADNGAPFFFRVSIQRWLDEHELSVFRHVPSDAALKRKVADERHEMVPAALAELEAPDQIAYTPDGRLGGTWELGELTAAIAGAPEATPADLERVKRRIELIFEPGLATESRGVAYGWLWYQLKNPQAEAALWPVIAVSALLARPGALSSSERPRFVDHLLYAERAASLYYTSSGGWDHLPNQQPAQPYALPTTLDGLEAMLAVHRAGQPWLDATGRDRLPEMISSTCAYLIRVYDNHDEWRGNSGWHGTSEDNQLNPRLGLSLLAYSLLLERCGCRTATGGAR